MTLVDIEVPVDKAKRNGNGQYLARPLNGKRRFGFTRATTIAKTLTDEQFEAHWKRTTLAGGHLDPELAAECHRLLEAGDNHQAGKVAARAFSLAGGNVKRDRGSLVHSYTENKLRDPDYIVPDLYAAQVDAIIATVRARGFEFITDLCEQMVVIDELKIAGTVDFYLYHAATDTYYIGDLKTGSVNYGALEWAIQLHIYAIADCGYIQGEADDGSDDQRIDLPSVSRERAVIINAPLDTTDVDLYWLDISHGPELLGLCMKVRKARSLKSKVLTQFEGGGPDTPTTGDKGTANASSPAVVRSVDIPNQSAAAPVTSPAGSVSSPAGDIVHEAATAWIINRTDAIIDALSKQHVGAAWPVDVPRPLAIKAGDAVWSDGDLTAIANALDALERRHALELTLSADPRTLAAKRNEAQVKAVKAATPPPRLTPASDDDGPAPDDYVAELKRLAGEMQQSPDADVRARIARAQLWQRSAETAGVPWRTGQGLHNSTPMRVWAIGRAAIAATAHVDFDADDPDHRVRVLLETYCGDNAYTFPAGPLLGSLTTDQAIALWDMADEKAK